MSEGKGAYGRRQPEEQRRAAEKQRLREAPTAMLPPHVDRALISKRRFPMMVYDMSGEEAHNELSAARGERWRDRMDTEQARDVLARMCRITARRGYMPTRKTLWMNKRGQGWADHASRVVNWRRRLPWPGARRSKGSAGPPAHRAITGTTQRPGLTARPTGA